MRIALFKGRGWVSQAIEYAIWSDFSHAAWVFDKDAEAVAIGLVKSGEDLGKLHHFSEGSVVEAWTTGVVNSPSVETLHHDRTPVCFLRYKTPLTKQENRALILQLSQDIGLPYNFIGLLAFITRVEGHDKSVFCSQLVASRSQMIGRPLLARCKSRRVDPGMIWWSNELETDGEVVT